MSGLSLLKSNYVPSILGLYISGDSTFVSIDNHDPSYWDVLQNTWGLVILSLELIIYRICRLINLSVKNQKIDPEKEEHRSDILSVLNDMDRLAKGAYNQQLCSVKHFFKQKMEGYEGDPAYY